MYTYIHWHIHLHLHLHLHVRICIHRPMHTQRNTHGCTFIHIDAYTYAQKSYTQQGAVETDGSAYETLLKFPWLEKSAKSSSMLDAEAVGDAKP